MAATTLLSTDVTTAGSADIDLLDGESAILILTHLTGVPALVIQSGLSVEIKDASGNYWAVGAWTAQERSLRIMGPAVYRVVRDALPAGAPAIGCDRA